VSVPKSRSPATQTATALQHYRSKRDFERTPEPEAAVRKRPGNARLFVVQKHEARRLHYDFRLELDGVLLSWAVPKGPSLDPKDKRMAVRTEDHPLAYADFEGTIPAGNYGAGTVIVWDHGRWMPLEDPHEGLRRGKLAFELQGHKLQGRWELVRMRKSDERQEAWLLFKQRDAAARARGTQDVLDALPDSVLGDGASTPPPAPVVAAPAAPMPRQLAPQLATLATALPESGQWGFEQKFDGYRLLARIEDGAPRLLTRNGHDWTDRMTALADELAACRIDSAWLDGEIVVAGADGTADFNALQNAFDRRRTQDIHYHLFDLPYFEGHDLRDVPLQARRDLLRQLLQAHGGAHLHFSEALGMGGRAAARLLLQKACAEGHEGLIAKRVDAPYCGARDTSWLKLKCQRRQEFVVGGYTVRSDDAQAVGSLILGVHDAQGSLQHAGSVGTGWNRAAARELLQQLRKLDCPAPPFEGGPRAAGRWSKAAQSPHWVRPRLVVEVAFAEWTPAGHIRHASFVAVRGDKAARTITRERPLAPAEVSAAEPAARSSRKKARDTQAPAPGLRVRLTHAERVIDASSGLTKADLAHFYDSIAEFLLPHLKARPVALVRGPKGVEGPLFFQKHGGAGIAGIRELDADLWPGHEPLLELATHQALLGAAQMNVIEFHTWNATTRRLEHPDRMVFDLDPGEGVTWPAIREAAVLTRTLLQELGLQSWLKTSGGKGLHLVVPIVARWSHDIVKGLSQAAVQHLARTIPSRFVAKSGPTNRVGRIFVDYLRNGEGATTVAAFSARARPGLGVSMPLDWDELPDLKSASQWTIANARDRLGSHPLQPWLALRPQTLGPAMKALGHNAEQSAAPVAQGKTRAGRR